MHKNILINKNTLLVRVLAYVVLGCILWLAASLGIYVMLFLALLPFEFGSEKYSQTLNTIYFFVQVFFTFSFLYAMILLIVNDVQERNKKDGSKICIHHNEE